MHGSCICVYACTYRRSNYLHSRFQKHFPGITVTRKWQCKHCTIIIGRVPNCIGRVPNCIGCALLLHAVKSLVRLRSFGSLVLWISLRSPPDLLHRWNSHVDKQSVMSKFRDLNLFLLKRVRGQLKMSDFPPNCVRFVVYGGVRIINGNIRTSTNNIRKKFCKFCVRWSNLCGNKAKMRESWQVGKLVFACLWVAGNEVSKQRHNTRTKP